MISLVKCQVPLYLRTSCFYQAIEDDDDSFEVPSDCFKENQFVESEADLRLLLSTLRFWGSDQMPASIVTFVSLHSPKLVLSTFAVFKQELRYLSFLEALCVGTDANSSAVYNAFNGCIVNARFDAEVNEAAAQICILQYKNCDGRVWDYDTCRLAAKFGLLDVLKFLQQHGCPWDARTCSTAAEWGHLHVLQYAHAHGCSWDEETCREAARKGNLTCLQYAVENDCPYGERILLAASQNYSKCFEYLNKLRSLSGPQQCAIAAEKGSLTLLKKLRDKGCAWDETTPANAARGGYLEILKYAHENGCPWDASTCSAAAESSLECLQYAHKNGCPWDEHTTGFACRLRIEKYWLSTAPRSAKTLKYAHEHGCPWNVNFIYPAIIWDNYEALEYALAHGCPTNAEVLLFTVSCGDGKMMEIVHRHGFRFGERAVEEAISVSGHKIKNLEFLLQHGYPCGQNACTLAAAQSLPGLKLIRERGCPWDESTCREAASKSLECLRYAHEHGCPWDSRTTEEACKLHTYISVFPYCRRFFSIATLQYAHEHGCPWNSDCIRIAVMWNHLEAIKYAHEHGCAWAVGTLQLAAQYSNVDTLEYVTRNGCALTTDALHAAILGDKIVNLRFLLQNRCPFVTSTSSVAAAQSLQYLIVVHEHGCPWDKDTCAAAARADKLDCLRYLRTHGCPWDIGTVRAAMVGGSLSCLKYAHENGCEWDASLVNKIPLSSKTRKCIEYVQDHPHPVLKPQQASVTVPFPQLKAPRSQRRCTCDRKQSPVPQRVEYMTRSRARAVADTAHLDGQRVAKRRKLH